MRRAVAVVRSATALGLTGAAKILRTGADAFSGLAGVVRRPPPGPAEAAQRGAQQTERSVTGAARRARGTAQRAADTAAGTVEDAAEGTADAVQGAADSAAGAVEDAADMTAAAADSAADVTAGAADTAASAVEGAAEAAAGTAEQAAEGTADAVQGAAGAAAGAVEDAADEAGAETPAPGGGPEVTAADIAETFEERGSVRAPSSTDVPEVAHAAAPPSHVAELARGTVAQVVDAIDGLSTDELRQLLEHEQANKRRRGVLDAVEQALTP